MPLSFAADYPDPFANLSAEERELRTVIGTDQCMIDQQEFYIRGCLEIPVLGTGDVFLWGLWARVHETDFDEISDNWETEGREHLIGPYKARLANELSIYSETLNLKLEIRVSPVGTRPLFILNEAPNSLYVDQHEGISPQKAAHYACRLMQKLEN